MKTKARSRPASAKKKASPKPSASTTSEKTKTPPTTLVMMTARGAEYRVEKSVLFPDRWLIVRRYGGALPMVLADFDDVSIANNVLQAMHDLAVETAGLAVQRLVFGT